MDKYNTILYKFNCLAIHTNFFYRAACYIYVSKRHKHKTLCYAQFVNMFHNSDASRILPDTGKRIQIEPDRLK